jgi:Right handed beta helix region
MPRKHSYRPSIEVLEDRWVPSTFTVTNLRDNRLGTPLIGGSLRHAIQQANNHPGQDAVVFKAGLQGTIKLEGGELLISDHLVLSGPGAGSIKIDSNHNSRSFAVLDDLPGNHTGKVLKVTLSGMTLLNGFGDFQGGVIYNGGENLTLRGMVIRNGYTRTAGGGIYTAGPLRIENSTILENESRFSGGSGNGGGVYAQHDGSLYSLLPAVVIVNSRFSDNTAGQGGGIQVETADLTIVNSTFTDNRSDGVASGGGVYSANNLVTIRDSTFRGNQTTGGAGGGIAVTNGIQVSITRSRIVGNSADFGGGVASSAEATTITNSRITGNRAGVTGAGVAAGLTTIRGCTISENVSQGSAGGLSITGSLTLLNSTVNGNSASAGSGGGILLRNITTPSLIRSSTISGNLATEGGGLRIENSAEVSVQNSTIALNRSLGGAGISTSVASLSLTSTLCAWNASAVNIRDVTVGFTTFVANFSLLGNYSFDPDGSTVTLDAVTTALLGNSPELAPLADNGGPTQTHALKKGSSAINQGSNPGHLAADQRGGLFKRKVGAGVDIGAFERQ